MMIYGETCAPKTVMLYEAAITCIERSERSIWRRRESIASASMFQAPYKS